MDAFYPGFLEHVIDWIRENLEPADVFDGAKLKSWAEFNGEFGRIRANLSDQQRRLDEECARFRRDPWGYCAPPIEFRYFLASNNKRIFEVKVQGRDFQAVEVVRNINYVLREISPGEAYHIRKSEI